MKIGDKVRFLSEVGGGIVRGFQGKDVALVEGDDGFEIPMLIKSVSLFRPMITIFPLNRPKSLKLRNRKRKWKKKSRLRTVLQKYVETMC